MNQFFAWKIIKLPNPDWTLYVIWINLLLMKRKLINFDWIVNNLIVHNLLINDLNLKLLSAIFFQIFIFLQMIVLQKLWKMFFISSKKLFSFSRYSDFCIFVSPPVRHCFRGWSKVNLKVYNVINCPNQNFITHFVWHL